MRMRLNICSKLSFMLFKILISEDPWLLMYTSLTLEMTILFQDFQQTENFV